ncbi:MAG TPA: hypothetical protein PKW33_00160 [Anaerolineaceae bacterium]|nr:hypothetical protein [Anaerolineaceae bacterium]HPN49969.1 hypothetical protein [Anaerolineaceae bacterium]
MIKKSWMVNLEDGPHAVQLEQNLLGTSSYITLDGRRLEDVKITRSNMGDTDYEFMIGVHTGKVMARNNFWTYQFDLAVDEKSVSTGAAPKPHNILPRWSYFFFVACGILPIMFISIFTALLGFGGLLGCAYVARDESKPEKTRIIICAVITGLAWIIFIGLVAGISALAG